MTLKPTTRLRGLKPVSQGIFGKGSFAVKTYDPI